MPGHRPVIGLRLLPADIHHARDPAAPLVGPPPRPAQRPPGPQVRGQLPAQRPAALHVQRLVDRLRRHPHSSGSSGNSRRSRALTCSGDQFPVSLACTHSRSLLLAARGRWPSGAAPAPPPAPAPAPPGTPADCCSGRSPGSPSTPGAPAACPAPAAPAPAPGPARSPPAPPATGTAPAPPPPSPALPPPAARNHSNP